MLSNFTTKKIALLHSKNLWKDKRLGIQFYFDQCDNKQQLLDKKITNCF